MSGGPSSLVHRFTAAMARLVPFESNPLLGVAVSGGADSLALALLADNWARARGGSVIGLVVDHGLRAASKAEALATIERLKQRAIAARLLMITSLVRGPGIAERARLERYRVLVAACEEIGCLHLLVGHHRADQCETVMMRALGNSRSAGLAAMAALSELARVRLLRPLLSLSPADLRAYLRVQDVGWVEDPSNHDAAALRARLRSPSRADARRRGPEYGSPDRAGAEMIAPCVDDAGMTDPELAGADVADPDRGSANLTGRDQAGPGAAGLDRAGANVMGRDRAGARVAGLNQAGANLTGRDRADSRVGRPSRARVGAVRSETAGRGTDSVVLADAASLAGRTRAGAERLAADILAGRTSLYPQGYALLSPGRVHPDALSALLQTIAGAFFPPPTAAVERLAAEPQPATLGGVRVLPAGRLGPGWLLVRETAAMAPPVAAVPGTVWDGRFQLTGAMSDSLWLGALGSDCTRFRCRSGLPEAILRTIPAIRDGLELVAAPHVGYHRVDCANASVLFCPPRPMAGASFCPALASIETYG